jgi:hypothetical protein
MVEVQEEQQYKKHTRKVHKASTFSNQTSEEPSFEEKQKLASCLILANPHAPLRYAATSRPEQVENISLHINRFRGEVTADDLQHLDVKNEKKREDFRKLHSEKDWKSDHRHLLDEVIISQQKNKTKLNTTK